MKSLGKEIKTINAKSELLKEFVKEGTRNSCGRAGTEKVWCAKISNYETMALHKKEWLKISKYDLELGLSQINNGEFCRLYYSISTSNKYANTLDICIVKKNDEYFVFETCAKANKFLNE